MRSNLESNLKHIKREIGLSPWIYWGSRLKYELSIANRNPVPTEDDWRIGLAQKLCIDSKTTRVYNGHEQNEELKNMINSLVTT